MPKIWACMLLVKTYLGESPIAGKGLFASEDIKKGTVVWRFHDKLDLALSVEEYNNLPAVQKEYMDIYSYLSDDGYILCGDHSKFMNHDDEPNTIEDGLDCIASRDIAKDEEITCNYFHFDRNVK